MTRVAGIALAALLAAVTVIAQSARTTLDIYLIDVEGGNATLFVSPAGESLLIDTGNGGPGAARDADRIVAAARDAGVTRIDHLITTHYHGDHFGAMAEVAGRLPVGQFIDHGANVQPNAATDAFLQKTYPELYAKGRHTVVAPGDSVPMTGLDVRVVASAGKAVTRAVPGGGQANPACAAHTPQDPDPSENAHSVGTHVTFGRFRLVHMGDLTWNKEFELMCPANRLGTVDVFVVSHHGQVLFSSPGLEDLWQLHFSLLSGQEYTVPGAFIANTVDEQAPAMPIAPTPAPAPGPGAAPPPAHNGAACWIKVSANRDGSFSVTNSRNNFKKNYGVAR